MPAGYYISKYKGQTIEVVKTYVPHENNKSYWYCKVNGAPANDYSLTKSDCLNSARYMIDNADEYGISLIN